MAEAKSTRVLIVGAGPVGLLTAVLLAKCGIDVEVLESATEIDQRPRGIAYGAPAVRYDFSSSHRGTKIIALKSFRVLRRAGVLDKAFEMGVEGKRLLWRELGGKHVRVLPTNRYIESSLDYTGRSLASTLLVTLRSLIEHSSCPSISWLAYCTKKPKASTM